MHLIGIGAFGAPPSPTSNKLGLDKHVHINYSLIELEINISVVEYRST